MSRTSLVFVLMSVLHAAKPCRNPQALTVRLFNDAAVDSATLNVSKIETAWALRSIGVTVRWMDCPPATPTGVCHASGASVELHLLLVPLTRDTTADALGFAMPDIPPGDHTAVFIKRTREEAVRADVPFDAILGYVMAHEIGHILLQSRAHSDEGLMKGNFESRDFHQAAQRQLMFSAADRSTACTSLELLAAARR